MAKIQAVQCDACNRIEVPVEEADIPGGWFMLDIYEQGVGNWEAVVYCSWACVADVAQKRSTTPKVKRKRRTKAEMLAAQTNVT